MERSVLLPRSLVRSPTYVEYLPLHLHYMRICASAWKVLMSGALLLFLHQGLGASAWDLARVARSQASLSLSI